MFNLEIPINSMSFGQVGWGANVWKLQGITCDHIVVDFINSFAEHSVYVALSRARTAEGLKIMNFSPRFIKCNERCLDFCRSIEQPKS